MLEFVLCSFVLEDSKYSNYDTSSMSYGVEGYDLLINVWRESIGCIEPKETFNRATEL